MRIQYDRFPNGTKKALTLSFDDGREYDRRLVKKLNDYGIRGTFHLNSGTLGKKGYIDASEVDSLYSGHEVSAHTVDHPFLEQTPPEQVIEQVMEDRKALEALVHYPVKGISYPFGTYNDQVVGLLKSVGMEYARTVNSHGAFHKPDDWLRWHPTCHHKEMVEYAEKFVLMQQMFSKMAILYVWGHSYEFENDHNWNLVDRFGEIIGGRDDIWYATNAEIYAYCNALNKLRFSADCRMIHNPSAKTVWISVDGESLELQGGQITRL
ncbi:polysaccharide deacetylase family protein [Paenibacillus sp. MDMC362]|uniref:polysaccharide deacetylase family protein n=1 Tax=Paenibacillus sp. MDMC362 TaxID=2977365 RepID=UPI000DC519D1|nr:polysaccharide deacetylase family protein [Paenibacillus sp. MDMC362]RAR41589.1 polysaccharide deacetylase [Paenibacillus sp. MDMC362]